MAIGEYFDSMLAAARQGAAWAWEGLYRDLSGPVLGYATQRGAESPEDIASETFLQVARDIHRFDGDEHGFRAWVFVIAHRRIADERRVAGRQPLLSDGADVEVQADHQWLGNVEHDAMSSMSMIEVSALIRGLSAPQRDVILLRIIGDFSVADTARILNKSEGAVKVTQNRALKALREELSAQADSLSPR